MSSPFDLEDVLRRWQLGALRGEELPAIACDVLAAGFDCAALYELAGLDRPSMSEAGPLFRRVLQELGHFDGTMADRPIYFVARLAQRILDRDVGLIAGCREMMTIRRHANLYDDVGLDPFVYVESETDTLPVAAVRELWSKEALREVDQEIATAEALYRAAIEEACRALIERNSERAKT